MLLSDTQRSATNATPDCFNDLGRVSRGALRLDHQTNRSDVDVNVSTIRLSQGPGWRVRVVCVSRFFPFDGEVMR